MDLETFAEEVRQAAYHIICNARGGNNERCAELAAALCTKAAQVKTQARVQAEQSNPDRYDLSTLPAISAFDE